MTTNYERVGTLVRASRSTYSVTQGDRRPLPASIAIASDHALLLKGLPLGARNVLAELARYLKKANPFSSVFPAKETIAARIGITARSVYRHLKVLEDAGLIVREPQQHRKGTGIGEFLTGHIKLTHAGAACLGLVPAAPPALPGDAAVVAPAASRAPRKARPLTTRATAEDAVTPTPQQVMHSTPSDKMSVHNKSLTEPNLSALKRSAPKAMATVPAELTWLLRAGLKAGDIFFLMGLATQHRKRLSDICDAKRSTLIERKLTGRDLKAYLLTLTKADVCFRTLAERARSADAAAAELAAYARDAVLFKARFANVTLVARDFSALYQFDEHCAFARTWNGTAWSATPLHDLRPWMQAVRTGRLVLATRDATSHVGARSVVDCCHRPAVAPVTPRPKAQERRARAPQRTTTPADATVVREDRVIAPSSREAVAAMKALLLRGRGMCNATAQSR